MIKKIIFSVILLTLVTYSVSAVPVRIKDIGKIIEDRENQLMGFGLVVGLRNTGDSNHSLFTNKALTNMLKKLGISPENNKTFYSRNVAAVMVTTDLPPFVKEGQRIDVNISSIGDSSSLVGGTLIQTQLKGADLMTYAVAQGPLLVGGVSGISNKLTYVKNQTTVGRIPDGGIVEKEIPVTMIDQHHITIVLDKPNFINASKVSKAIQKSGFTGTKAIDANTIKVPLSQLNSSDFVGIIAQLENIMVEPDSSAKVVINSRTGTVVIGEMVRLFPVALTHGNISIRISDLYSGQSNLFSTQKGSQVSVSEPNNKLVHLAPKSTLSSLVKALNQVGASPKDLISIIQALKESGALIAEVYIL